MKYLGLLYKSSIRNVVNQTHYIKRQRFAYLGLGVMYPPLNVIKKSRTKVSSFNIRWFSYISNVFTSKFPGFSPERLITHVLLFSKRLEISSYKWSQFYTIKYQWNISAAVRLVTTAGYSYNLARGKKENNQPIFFLHVPSIHCDWWVASAEICPKLSFKLLDPPDQYTLNYGGAAVESTHTIQMIWNHPLSFWNCSNTSSSLSFSFDFLFSLPAFEVSHLQSLFLQRSALNPISWLCHLLPSSHTSRIH